MGISKLTRGTEECIAGAFIFSGRPDPVWNVSQNVVRKLENLWQALEYVAESRPSGPTLGYRGCYLRCKPDIEWFAYGGVVTKKTPNSHEFRKDKNRNFERMLLDSSPKGILPDGIL
jgi:hypothetical protein